MELKLTGYLRITILLLYKKTSKETNKQRNKKQEQKTNKETNKKNKTNQQQQQQTKTGEISIFRTFTAKF